MRKSKKKMIAIIAHNGPAEFQPMVFGQPVAPPATTRAKATTTARKLGLRVADRDDPDACNQLAHLATGYNPRRERRAAKKLYRGGRP